ncbi:hypothetical protein BV22DRAFT_989237, partial [Leucogyrophana mollusca]
PTWLVDAVDYLNSADASPEWSAMVINLVKLERLLGFPKGMGKHNIVSGLKRPEEIGAWIRGGRHFEKCPTIEDEKTFADGFEQWWISLQPAWRCTSDDDEPVTSIHSLLNDIPSEDVDWPELAKGTCNGFFMVLLGLTWW